MYPLIRIDDLLEQLKYASIFSKIILISRYHQLRIKNLDTHKMTFKTKYGHYEFVVLSFGLTNASTTFKNLINNIFHEYLDKFILLFLYDILIYSRNKYKHDYHLRKVLEVLRKHQHFGKLSNYEFYVPQFQYLRHIISIEGMFVDPKNIEVIMSWLAPTSMIEVISFMGLAGYY